MYKVIIIYHSQVQLKYKIERYLNPDYSTNFLLSGSALTIKSARDISPRKLEPIILKKENKTNISPLKVSSARKYKPDVFYQPSIIINYKTPRMRYLYKRPLKIRLAPLLGSYDVSNDLNITLKKL